VLLRVVILNYYLYFVVNLCRTEIIYVKLIFFLMFATHIFRGSLISANYCFRPYCHRLTT
jgi:hypothetical protein